MTDTLVAGATRVLRGDCEMHYKAHPNGGINTIKTAANQPFKQVQKAWRSLLFSRWMVGSEAKSLDRRFDPRWEVGAQWPSPVIDVKPAGALFSPARHRPASTSGQAPFVVGQNKLAPMAFCLQAGWDHVRGSR